MRPKNFINRLLENYAEKRLFGYGPTEDWSYVDQMQGPTKDIRLLGMYSGVAYRCINTIAEAMASQYQPYFYTTDTKGKKNTVPTHPFLTLLQQPNPDMSYYQLIEGSQSFLEQFGEFFWYMVPGSITGYGNGVKEIYLLRPDKMGITLDKATGEVIGYTYNATGSKKIPFDAQEIKHFMTFNPKNPYRGFSTVEAAIDYIQTEEEVSKFTRNYFRNNAAMSGIVSVSGKVPRESWNKFVRQWRERYAGVDNAGKVALVRDSQITFTPISSSISDMQLTDLKETTVDQILMMFRIPKGLFGMESDQGLGRASVETLEYIFAKWTMNNKMSRFDDLIQSCLQSYYAGSSKGFMVDHLNIIPDDKEYQLNFYNQGVDRWITRQEIRDKDPDLANNDVAGAQQLFTTIQQIPLEDAGTQPSSSSTSSAKKYTLTAKKKLEKSLDYTHAQKEAHRLGVEKNSDAYARKYKQSFVKLLEQQKQTVLGNIQHLAGKSLKALGDTLLDLSDEDTDFQSELMPVLTSLMLEQGQLALEFSGSPADVKYNTSKAILNAIQQSTKKMAQNFNQETIDQLSDTLSAGMQAGDTLTQLSDRVEQTYEQAQGYRADRIARTESMNASNSATLDAYRQNPVVTSMQWFANPGACPYCADLDGTVVGLEESFVNQGDSVDVTDDDGNTSSYQADYGDVDILALAPKLHMHDNTRNRR